MFLETQRSEFLVLFENTGPILAESTESSHHPVASNHTSRPASNKTDSECSAHLVESLFGRPKLRNNLELNCQEIISGVKPIKIKHEKIVSCL